ITTICRIGKKMASDFSSQVRVRFAPSPTGHLHIGSFRTALFNWLFARHHGGTFLVRIEDTDLERSMQEYVHSIMAALDWVNLQADEPIVIQSERLQEHVRVLQKMVQEGTAYKCFCTQQEVADRSNDSEFISYDGLCRTADQSMDKPHVIRFKLPDITQVSFDDLIRGTITVPAGQLDDFIIARSDGTPTYNFVVVVDDAAMRITHVIRGEDHISNTPKQILLYQACGYRIPQFAHMPLILGPSGDRLSKRDGATSALAYKQMGYLPDALVNYLVRLGWSHGDQEIFSREQLVEFFTLDAVGKKGSIFDIEKLKWMNGVYIRERSAKELLSYISTQLDGDFVSRLSGWNTTQIEQAIALYTERVHTLIELMQEVELLYNGPKQYQQSEIEKWTDSQTKEHLTALITMIQNDKPDTLDALKDAVKSLTKTMGIKFVQLAQPMRIALIGSSAGPGVFEMFFVVGLHEALARLERLRDTIE
ncbi:MAG TPA: glutamate--tRNA ligase, partial [Candidatus Babeliales bacterium]|nr:glutamate--tRNA ligase [Candidatus Babeliales bacterium]